MKSKILTIFVACAAFSASAGVEHLMPKVKSVETTSAGAFALGREVAVTDPTEAAWLTTTLGEMGLTVNPSAAAKVTVEVVSEIPGAFNHNVPDYPDEAYSISVSPDEIAIKVLNQTGTIRAAQTLAQLAMEADAIESVNITDWPAFKVRGFLQDIGRSYLSVEELKREIDLLSRFKVNTFHWHLTDYTGWRFEVKAYPELTGDGGIIRDKGKFYTQAECREIQDYAAERGMIVLPEIDMPGHSHPFVNVMGHEMFTTEGKAELKQILTEAAEVFDKAPYIHIGGDEKHFDDADLLEMVKYAQDNLGKKVVIWNQYNNGPKKNVNVSTMPVDMVTNWRPEGTKAAGVVNVDQRYKYSNLYDVFADVAGIYRSNILYSQQGTDEVGGATCAFWSDTQLRSSDEIPRQNNLYATILSIGERAWMGGGDQYIEKGGSNLANSGKDFDEFADWEARFLYHKDHTLAAAKEQIPYVRQTNVKWLITDRFANGGKPDTKFAPEDYITAERMPTSFEQDGVTYGTAPATGAGVFLRHTWDEIPAFYPSFQANVTSYAWTNIYSETEQDCGAFIEFYTYQRSDDNTTPDAGKWDRFGSQIWWKGEEIPAPEWEQPGVHFVRDKADQGLKNENFTARPVTKLHLQKGWNRVFLKLCYPTKNQMSRYNWNFTFVLTDEDGSNALDGIIYSPLQCLNAADEQLMTLIATARTAVGSKIKDAVGYYPSNSAAEALSAKADELEADLDTERKAEERAAQVEELQKLLDALNASLEGAQINQPQEKVYYYLHTPGRDDRYASASGSNVTGKEKATKTGAWKFVTRSDGDYDIVNYSNKKYLSPDVAFNSQLTVSADIPSAGWQVKPSDTVGFVIITSGTTQLNQTNSGLSYKVYNWGLGTNVSDAGCKYAVTESEYKDEEDGISSIEITEDYTIYDLQGRRVLSPTHGLYIVNRKMKIL